MAVLETVPANVFVKAAKCAHNPSSSKVFKMEGTQSIRRVLQKYHEPEAEDCKKKTNQGKLPYLSQGFQIDVFSVELENIQL